MEAVPPSVTESFSVYLITGSSLQVKRKRKISPVLFNLAILSLINFKYTGCSNFILPKIIRCVRTKGIKIFAQKDKKC